MNPADSTRRVALFLLLGTSMACAQSTLPATHPTAPAPATPANPSPAAAKVPPAPTYVATVTYVQGQLKISAQNSSLNEILRQIVRTTGMTITGGVVEQSVFGDYGPASLAEVLANLLQGTGTNMMLLNSASNAPAKLILTPQHGGPSPPNPNATGFDEYTDANGYVRAMPSNDPRLNVPPPLHHPLRPVYAPPEPVPEPAPLAAPTIVTTDPAPTPVPADNPTSPNGVQTPQQIYQQLLQLQNAQPKR